MYIADWGNHRIRKVTVSTGIITTIAGSGGTGGYSGDGGAATSAALHYPAGVALDASGRTLIITVCCTVCCTVIRALRNAILGRHKLIFPHPI